MVARLSAWGTTGPWADRRGFDSLVQVATGIALVEGSGERPGVLPAQALDHGTGYLLAAAVLQALAAQSSGAAGGQLAELALARTAGWLLELPRDGSHPPDPADVAPTVVDLDGMIYAQPPVTLPGGPVSWPAAARPWGADPPKWSAHA